LNFLDCCDQELPLGDKNRKFVSSDPGHFFWKPL